MDFLNYFSRNQHIRNYKKRYSDFKEENHCRPVLFDFKNAKKKKKKNHTSTIYAFMLCQVSVYGFFT